MLIRTLSLTALIVALVSASAAQAGSIAPTKTTAVVKSYGEHTYQRTFFKSEVAIVLVDGDGDSDLDVFVYDENGKLIAQDIGLTDKCTVTWTPRWTGPFTIKVKNLGVANRYVIRTN